MQVSASCACVDAWLCLLCVKIWEVSALEVEASSAWLQATILRRGTRRKGTRSRARTPDSSKATAATRRIRATQTSRTSRNRATLSSKDIPSRAISPRCVLCHDLRTSLAGL